MGLDVGGTRGSRDREVFYTIHTSDGAERARHSFREEQLAGALAKGKDDLLRSVFLEGATLSVRATLAWSLPSSQSGK